MLALVLSVAFVADQPESPLAKSRKVVETEVSDGKTISLLIAINTIRMDGSKADVPLLMKLRGDHRCLGGTSRFLSRVSDAAAMAAVSLLGGDTRDFAQHAEYGLVNPPGVVIRQYDFGSEAERADAGREAWNWVVKNAWKK